MSAADAIVAEVLTGRIARVDGRIDGPALADVLRESARRHATFTEVAGAEWCVTHQGIVDECANHLDDEGEPACDMYDGRDTPERCDIRTLYVKGARS